jgi:hypothetical protein
LGGGDILIVHKLTFKQWQYIATHDKVYLPENVTSVPRTKNFVKDKFKGDLNMDVGFGHITFESEKDLSWFLLSI